jgi:uncharacterized protein
LDGHSTARLAPVGSASRLEAIDVLRGFALLGILIMNIRSMSMITAAYFFPTAYGDLTGVNLIVWWAGDLLANRKFMTIFSLLFGAGILLQSERAQAAGRSFAWMHYRRMFWLLLIGLVHAYLFWDGDILVTYALCGLVLYPARKLRPRALIIIGLVILAIGSGLMLMSGLTAPYWGERELAEFEATWQPSPEKVQAEIEAMTGNWLGEVRHRFPKVVEMHLFVIPFHMLWRGLGGMFLGMALFKMGLLQELPRRTLRLWLILAVVVGLPLTALGAVRQFQSGWDPVTAFFVDSQFGYWASLLVALGWIALVQLGLQRGWMPALRARLAAVGRTALSNYLLHTLVCTTIFNGRGFGFFGEVPRWGQVLVVVGVWILQLWLAPWWLARFRFGPMEWLWRSLSYWRLQPMRRSG